MRQESRQKSKKKNPVKPRKREPKVPTPVKHDIVMSETYPRVFSGVKVGGQFVSGVFVDYLKDRPGKKKDLTYPEMHQLSRRLQDKASREAIRKGIAAGCTLPMDITGRIPVDKKYDIDAQLTAYHVLRFQHCHLRPRKTPEERAYKTSPALAKEIAATNAYRAHELNKTKMMLTKRYSAYPHVVIPQTPQTPAQVKGKGKRVAVQLDRMFPGPIDINRQQSGTLFAHETSKGVFKEMKDVCRTAYENAVSHGFNGTSASQCYLSKALLDKLNAGQPNGKTYWQQALGITVVSRGEKDVDSATDSELSFDIQSVSGDTDISGLYDPEDTLEPAVKKRQHILTAFGLMAKVTGQKRLLSPDNKDVNKYGHFIDRLNRNAQKRNDKHHVRFTWLYHLYSRLKKNDLALPTTKLKESGGQKWV